VVGSSAGNPDCGQQEKACYGDVAFLANTFEKLDLATVRRTNGDEAILCHNGSVISMGVARADEHGGSPDLLCVDELWDISPEVLFDAFRPSQIAKPNPLLACFSTAGTQASTAMQMLREQALHAIDKGITNGIYWCEWSPPPGVNMEDRQWWPWSNPALGTTIQWRSLEKAFAGPDRGAWLRAHGNLWIASADSWLPFGLWADRVTQVPIPDGGILCVDNSLDNETLVLAELGLSRMKAASLLRPNLLLIRCRKCGLRLIV
jgi:phage terminase large subunit-like protein